MDQVLTNLMDNAFKHVESCGRIETGLLREGDWVKRIVANSGDLIPVEEVDKIWESFYQVDTDSDGNGLGLTIVKSIVELHGGSVCVKIENGMNVFVISLPCI